MATVINLELPENQTPVPVTRRLRDDLPAHVKGDIQWINNNSRSQRHSPQTGYYLAPDRSPSHNPEPVELINNEWYGLTYVTCELQYYTRRNLRISPINVVGAGYWHITDPQHPQYQAPPSRAASRSEYRSTPGTFDSSPESDHESTVSAHTAEDTSSHQPIYVDPPTPPNVPDIKPSLDTITTGLERTATLQGSLPLDPPTMSVNTTTTVPTGSPSNGSMTGIAPAIFDGKRANAENFLNQFRRYKLMNEGNKVMSEPFLRILTALSYIRGTLVEDWVNAQDEWLEKRVDPTQRGHLARSDEALWLEFVDNFKTAWKDTSKVQTAYDKLMKLTMEGWDVDSYNVTFNRLASAAGWEHDGQGTIARYRSGLRNVVHRKILDRENWPVDMDGWQEAARKEVKRAREIENQGLNNFRRNQQSRDPGNFQTNQRNNTSTRTNNNNQIVPMEVDGTTIPFQKLTDEERIQYRKEGRCFRCRQQGHMASRCPKNANRNTSNQTNTTVRETTTTTTTPTTTVTTTPPDAVITPTPPGPKLTRAQRIRAIEEEMDEDERGAYLDARDMGEDFCNAEL